MGGSCSRTFSHKQHEHSSLAWRLIPHVCIIVVPFMSRLIKLSQYGILCCWKSLLHDSYSEETVDFTPTHDHFNQRPRCWEYEACGWSLDLWPQTTISLSSSEWLIGLCWSEDGSFFRVAKGVKDLVIFIKGQEEVYSSLSVDSNNLHLPFQLRESALSWHWNIRATPSPWAELGHLCLSRDQTCSSRKIHSWMPRRTCRVY